MECFSGVRFYAALSLCESAVSALGGGKSHIVFY